MAKKNYDEAAQAIIRNVGGRDNVDKVIHCITRLRFYLKDEKLADTSAITQIPEVAGAIYNGALGQYQVVIGPAVADVYDEVVASLTQLQQKLLLQLHNRQHQNLKMDLIL